ncbi:MAG: DUF5668 domain-containing protein [Candidatus Woesearchaeota archaeon]
MKPSKVFWGILLISLGILLLIFNFGDIPNYFNFVWYIWPLVFIFWGISLLNISLLIKQILAGLSGFIIALTIIGGLGTGYKFVSDSENSWEEEFSKFDKELIKSIGDSLLYYKFDSSFAFTNLFIEGGAGHYRIKDTTNFWIRIISDDFSENKLICDSSNKLIKVNLSNDYNFVKDRFDHKALIKLNINPIWNIAVNVGAVLFECDLSEFKVNKLDIQTGASKIKIRIGNKFDSTHINLSSGLASFNIEIPNSSGCIIYSETGLTKEQFEDFIKIDKKTYQTSNFENSDKKIFINISSGLSSFKIKRY